MVTRQCAMFVSLCLVPACVAVVSRAGSAQTDAERAALEQLKGRIAGEIVWESNRTGQWEIYGMNADGTGARQLTHLGKGSDPRAYDSYLRPRISPDGKTVLFAYGQQHAPVEVWIVPSQGGEARKLTVGSPLNWGPDGKGIFFLRDSQVWRYDMATGEEARVHPAKMPVDGRSGDTVGTVRADLKAAVFRAPRSNEYFSLDEGKTIKKMGGCEPRISADGRYVYWVQGPQDFRVWDTVTNEEHELLGTPDNHPHDYTYFPTVSADGRWLLCGASPGEHSHSTSDYEILLQELQNWRPVGKPVRLTFNPQTDRWPYLYVAPAGTAAALPDGPYDVAANPRTTPPPAPLTIFSFAEQDAGPDFGGYWGMWPEEGGCRGTATFMRGDDAEGNGGGSIRVDYQIDGEPNSVALWITPRGGMVDLSAYDRFVIHAKGDVPSFTLVVKDRNSEEEETPKGVADYFVKGITTRWQRFELPFADFKPRVRGATADWNGIKLIAVALIDPYDPLSGTLQVDNLQALPAAE
jgi:hypothetical protein